MPLPRDRESLLRLAEEAQRTVDDSRDPVNAGQTLKQAQDLFRLGEIRFRLDEMQDAERLLDESATGFLKVNDPAFGREWAVMARVRQSQVPMVEGRRDDALAIIERTVEECGFPKSERLPDARSGLADGWLMLLAQAEYWDRLYAAAGIALDQLDPTGPENERRVIARAFMYRADAARELGRREEAVGLYEKSIAQFKTVDPNLAGRQLIETAAKLTELQSELGLPKESLNAFGQMVSTSATTLPRFAMGRVRRSKQDRNT